MITNDSKKRVLATMTQWLAALAGCVAASAAHACDYASSNAYGNAPLVMTSPLSIGALTVGRDVPDGTILYTQTVRPQAAVLYCLDNTSWVDQRTLPSTPQPLSGWNTGKFAGKVYQTGVPGIGVAVWRDFNGGDFYPMTYSRDFNCPSAGTRCNYTLGTGVTYVSISLIKIGPVSPGAISGASLPTAQYAVFNEGNTTVLSRINFSGAINIVSQTCTTPDVTVPLGAHQVKSFSGQGSATPWQDFDIALRNCPAFLGATGTVNNLDSGSGFSLTSSTAPNTLGFSLTPTTPIVDPAQGIVALAPTSSGPAAATGVGLQVANASNAPVAYNTVMPSGIVPSATSGASYSIPLRARYVQTGSAAPTPGPANTSMMFTINYQ